MKTVLSTLALGLIALMPASPALAQSSKVLAAEVAALQTQVTTLQGQVTALKNAINSTDAQNAFALGQFVTVDTTDTINGLAAPHIIFTGANLHVRDGSGFTDDNGGALTGLGNLVIGYDDAPASPAVGYRSGVHNLVVGPRHTFNSFGGFVAGDTNAVEGPSASVSGGSDNAASGTRSSVSGGGFNAATGDHASVSGGSGNQATGTSASISGGVSNMATSLFSSVSGGSGNQATASGAAVGGGDAVINSTADTFAP